MVDDGGRHDLVGQQEGVRGSSFAELEVVAVGPLWDATAPHDRKFHVIVVGGGGYERGVWAPM